MIMDDTPAEDPNAMTSAPDTAQSAAASLSGHAAHAGEAAENLGQDALAAVRDQVETTVSETARAFSEARTRLNSVPEAAFEPAQAMDQFRVGVEALSSGLGAGYARVSQGLLEFNAKAIDAWRANAEASISHWQKLALASNWSEMVALTSAHTRQQIEAMTAQTHDFAELARQIARDIGRQSGATPPSG